MVPISVNGSYTIVHYEMYTKMQTTQLKFLLQHLWTRYTLETTSLEDELISLRAFQGPSKSVKGLQLWLTGPLLSHQGHALIFLSLVLSPLPGVLIPSLHVLARSHFFQKFYTFLPLFSFPNKLIKRQRYLYSEGSSSCHLTCDQI